MLKNYILFFTLLLYCTNLLAQGNFQSNATGNWSVAGSWTLISGTDADGIPDADDDIAILNTHTITVNAAARVCNNLTVNNGGVLQINNQNLTVNGTTTVSGTINDNDNTGTNTFIGKITVNNGGTFSTNFTSPYVFRGGIENNGTFNKAGGGTVTFNTNTQIINGANGVTMNGNITVATVNITIQTPFSTTGTFTIQGAVSVTNQSSVTINNAGNPALNGNNAASTWLNDDNSTLRYLGQTIMNTGILDADQTGNTVEYNRAGAQTIKAVNYYNLITSENGTKTLGANISIGNNLINSATGLTLTNVTNLPIGNNFEISNGTVLCTNTTADPTITINGNYIQTGGSLNLSSNNGGQTTINLKGNYTQNAGTITVSVTGAPAINSIISLNGTTVQTINGGGAMTAGIFETNNTNGFTVNSSANVYTLRLTNGVITSSATAFITVNNTATTGIVAGNAFSATNSIDGALARAFPNGSITGTYTFPIKKGANYEGFVQIINPNATGTTVLQAEVFNSNTGGTAGTGLNTLLNNGVYWQANINSGTLNSAQILLDIDGLNTITDKIGQSSTLAGAYTNIGGTVTATSITSSSTTFATTNYLAIGTKGNLAGGTYQVGGCGTFAKLTNVAFALNELTLMGDVIFELCPDYDGTAGEIFPIEFKQIDTDGGNPYTVTIRPRSDATSLQTSGTSSSGALVLLNGVDRLTLDGRPGGMGTAIEWTISNNVITQPTINFINDAQNNTIQYCTIEGSTTAANGVINFSTALSVGNDFNTIDHCNITDNTLARPYNCIYSVGTVGMENDNIFITNNNIFDFSAIRSNSVAGVIFVGANNNKWTIQYNDMYLTSSQSVGSANNLVPFIQITSGTNHLIDDNEIGGNSKGNSTMTLNSGPNASTIRLLPITTTGTNTQVVITNNEIHDIFISGSVGTNELAYRAINAGGGNITVQNNSIHDLEVENNANGGTATTAGQVIVGIVGTATNGEISNNFIYNFRSSNSFLTNRVSLIGIQAGTSGMVFRENQIYDFNNRSNHINGNTIGIDAYANNPILRSNHIYNLTSNATSVNNSVVGISLSAGSPTFGISGEENQIYALQNNSAGVGASIIGILNTTNASVAYNIVRDITSTVNTIIGISLSSNGSPTASNNQVYNLTNNATFATATLIGILQTANGSPNITNNTIYNLTSNTPTPGNNDILSVVGISLVAANGNPNITSNTIHTLRSTSAVTGTNALGIAVTNSSKGTFSGNRIYNLTNISNGSPTNPPVAAGFLLRDLSGGLTIQNNMISLGLNLDGTDNTEATQLVGIWNNFDDNQQLNIYYNSIQIAGNAGSGSYNTYGFLRGDNNGTSIATPVNILNNIFQNIRMGTGNHFAIGNQATSSGWATGRGDCAGNLNKTVDYNALYSASGNYGNWLGNAYNFSSWQTNSQGDDHSIDLTTPISTFTDASTANFHIPNSEIRINAKGLFISAGTDTDFDGMTRRGPDIGADELDNIFVFSGVGGDWNLASTWDLNTVPSHADIVRITDDIFIQDNQTGYFYQLEIQPGNTLTLQGNAKLYGCWWDGFFINDGTLDFLANGELHLAGDLEDNNALNRGTSTVFMNVDDFPFAANLCVLDNYLIDVNNNSAISDLIGDAHTNFHNFTVLNNGNTTIQNNAKTITVFNELDIQGTGRLAIGDNLLQLNGTISTTGTGTLSGSNLSELIVNGSNSLGGTLRFTTGFEFLENLTINRTGTDNDVVLGTPLEVSNFLTLIIGYINTTAVNLLTIAENASSTLGYNGSFVRGPMAKRTNSTTLYTFPVGKNRQIGNIGVLPSNATNTTYTAEYFQTTAYSVGTTVELPLDHVSHQEYWTLDRPSGAPTIVRLYWTGYSKVSTNPLDWDFLRVAKYDGTKWSEQSMTKGGIGTFPSGTIDSDEIDSFSPFTIGTRVPSNPLPTSFISLKATENQQKQVLLNWSTAIEINVAYFEIERSSDGIRFEKIASSDAKGNSQTIQEYSRLDENPLNILSYYRIKAVSLNGGDVYSPIVFISIENPHFKVYPIPTAEILNIEDYYSENTVLSWSIKDGNGIEIMQENQTVQKGNFKEKIAVHHLNSGIYFLEIIQKNQKKVIKFIKL